MRFDPLAIALRTTGTNDVRRITALGNNPDTDPTSVPEDIWPNGGVYQFQSNAVAMEVLSTSINDTSSGTGARTILVNGLDDNYDEISQIITLNGTTPVSIPINLKRINSSLIMSAGSGEVNGGDITIRVVSGAIVQALLPAGAGITRQAIYTVPNGYTLVVHSMVFTINRSTNTKDTIEIVTHVRSNQGFYREPLILGVDSRNSPYRHDGEPGITITEKNDFTLRCTYSENTNINITAGFLGILVRNTSIP